MGNIELVCIYTSGIRPLSNHIGLKNHDDWGVKYLHVDNQEPIKEWENLCEIVCQEARDFLQNTPEAVFVRVLEKKIVMAISDRENKGAFRRNILIAIFSKDSSNLFELFDLLHIEGECLPGALKKLKETPNAKITLKKNTEKSAKETTLNLLLRHGVPGENFDAESSGITRLPKEQHYKKQKPPYSLVAGVCIAIIVFWFMLSKKTQPTPNSQMKTTISHNFLKKTEPLETLTEQKNRELQGQIISLKRRLQKLNLQIHQKEDLAIKIGGWQVLKNLLDVLKDFNIAPENVGPMLKSNKENAKKRIYLKNNLQRVLDYLKEAQIGKGQWQNKRGEMVEASFLSTSQLNDIERQIQKIIGKF